MWDACSIVLLSVCCLERRQDQCVLVAGHLPVSTCGGIGPCDTPSSHHPGTQPGPGGSKEFWSRLRFDSRQEQALMLQTVISGQVPHTGNYLYLLVHQRNRPFGPIRLVWIEKASFFRIMHLAATCDAPWGQESFVPPWLHWAESVALHL